MDEILKEIIEETKKESKNEAVNESRRYVLKIWSGIEIYKQDPYVIGCSAEAHKTMRCLLGCPVVL